MRILVVAPFVPDCRAAHGGGMYLGALTRAMAKTVELGLVAFDHGKPPAAADFRWMATLPYPGAPKAGWRRAAMLWQWGACGRPLVAAKHRHPELPALLRRALAEFAPDAALVEMAPMAQYLRHLGQVPTILTDHEAGVPDQPATGLGAIADARDRRLWRHYVATEYRQATLLQAVTEEDAAAIGNLVQRPVARRQPALFVPRERIRCELAPPRALFLGDYRHHPNPEAATRLVLEVLPRLRAAEPATELWLAGPNHDRIAHLGSAAGVHVTGFVPELSDLFAQVRVMLAPLYSGGGFRMKSLTALANGLPVVTNQLGGRGVDAPSTARILAESPEDLAAAALRLLRSPAVTAAAADAAHAWARATLDADAVAKDQIDRIAALLATSPIRDREPRS